jgi:hypothetical protein
MSPKKSVKEYGTTVFGSRISKLACHDEKKITKSQPIFGQ